MARLDDIYPPMERECDEYRRVLEVLLEESGLDAAHDDSKSLADAKQQARAVLSKFRND